MENQLFLSLISGLVGSIIGTVIGAVLTFLITQYSLEKTAKKSLEFEQKKRDWDQKNQKKTTLSALLTEARENLESIKRWEEHRSKFKFSVEAWNLYKSNVTQLSTKLQGILISTYSKIAKSNTLIDYDIQLPLISSGNKDSEIERLVKDVKETLEPLIEELTQNLKS